MEQPIPILVVIFTLLLQNDAATWTYDGDLGPKHWHHLFPDGCSGKQQSPIDIETVNSVYDPKLNDFAIWHDPPKPGSLYRVHNNGHSITVNTFGPFYVANGGLPSVYSTAQFHFHWGHANHHGSEHFIDGRASPLELHVVNYDSDNYPDIAKAMVQPMGLAVLGTMYEVGDNDNEALEPIIQALEHVRDPEDDNEKEISAQPIRNFLPMDTTKYYRYNGSLTTPGCFESVIWTVFHEPQYISQRQLEAFRKVLQNKRHKKHKKHHKRQKRSKTNEEKMVEEVLEEVGIKDDPLAKLELKAELLNKQAEDTAPSESPSLGEPPKKFYLHHGENPSKENLMKDVNQTSTQEQSYDHVETENEKHLEEIVVELEHQIDRLTLINNFRPIQPLNGRTVYRSFRKFVTQPEQVETANQVNNDPGNQSINTVASWSVLILSLLLTFFR